MSEPTIANLLSEDRTFPPSPEFTAQANANSADLWEQGQDLEKFWADYAEKFEWFEKWNQVLEWNPPFAKWFLGGKLNITVNCIDRHLKGARRNKAASWPIRPSRSASPAPRRTRAACTS